MSEKLVTPIDLNLADAETLATLPGLGPKLAARIIQYREENGSFAYPADITGVSGISSDLFLQFADQVTVTPPKPVEESGETEKAEDAQPDDSEAAPKPPAPDSEISAEDEPDEEGYILMWGEDEQADEAEVEESAIVPILGTESTKTESVATKQGPPAKPVKQSIWRPWVLMIVALFGGAVLALLVIQALNGTLMLGSQAEIAALNNQLDSLERENKAMDKQIEEMQATLDQYANLSNELQNSQAEILLLKQARDKLESQTETLTQRADTLDGSVISLAEEAVKLQKAITQLENDAGRFNTFLTGLRALLTSVEGEPDAGLLLTPTTPEKNTTPTPTATPRN